jgi:DNA polymerase III delta subunit
MTQHEGSYIEYLQYLSKNPPSNKYFLFGKQDFLKNSIVSNIKKQFGETGEYERNLLFGKDFDLNYFNDLISSNAFFFSRKIIEIKEMYSMNKKALKEAFASKYISNLPEGIIIIISDEHEMSEYKKDILDIFKDFLFLHDKSISKRQLITWIKSKFKTYKKEVSTEIVEALLNYTSYDVDNSLKIVDRICLSNLDNEINWETEIKKYAKDQDYVIFDLSDSLINNRTKKTVVIYDDLINMGMSNEEILYFLINHYSFLCEVKLVSIKYNSKENFLNYYKDKSKYRYEKAYEQVHRIKLQKLNKMLEYLVDIDKKMKIGYETDLSNMLTLFLGSSSSLSSCSS